MILIGEALNRVRKLNPDVASAVPELPAVIAFRNVLVHDYTEIDNDRVWHVIKTRVPELIDAITELLKQAEPF